jgi:N-acetylglutamate synthase-like GNAT family acetyltransferase
LKKEKIERVEIGPARLEEQEIEQILSLAKYFVKKGQILKRSRRKVKRMVEKKELRIARKISDQEIIGFCACKILNLEQAVLHFLVAKRGRPFIAERLIKSWLKSLKILRFKSVFLTTRADNRLRYTVFKHCGFKEIPIWKAPLQISLPLLWRRLLGRESIVMVKYF